jgi:glycoprotein endo-alpha-1,2-mannosidase
VCADDSYHIASHEWGALFDDREGSIRGSSDDGTFIGLWLDSHHGQDLAAGHFDGAYTYFASVGFSWGATLGNWKEIHSWAEGEDKIFVASVGPGYNDEGIRPWNAHNTKPREIGEYLL